MSERAKKVRDDMRAVVWNKAKAMCDTLVAECGTDKERADIFVRLVEDAHEYALVQIKKLRLGLT